VSGDLCGGRALLIEAGKRKRQGYLALLMPWFGGGGAMVHCHGAVAIGSLQTLLWKKKSYTPSLRASQSQHPAVMASVALGSWHWCTAISL
jgi:hypothetical protein